MIESEREHLERVRDRFTRTAQRFAQFALGTRGDEAERLVRLALDGLPNAGESLTADLACGPGTFTQAFAPRVRFVIGLDLTPALLAEAERAAQRAGLRNTAFARTDVNLLPIRDAALDLVVCGYSLHHFLRPLRVVREMARVVRPSGRVALADLVVPEGADAELNNRIERTRDPSHVRTLSIADLHALAESAGLHLRATDTSERLRQFDEWMQIMGCLPGTPEHAETRRLMEESMPGDTAGFRPRLITAASSRTAAARAEIEYVQTSAFVIAEKE